jgi:hypothetical protein
MKLNFAKICFLFLFLTFFACREELVEIPSSDLTGKIYVDSQPDFAKIYLNNLFTEKLTPDSLINLEPGDYILSIRKLGYHDTTFFVNIIAGSKPYFSIELKQK